MTSDVTLTGGKYRSALAGFLIEGRGANHKSHAMTSSEIFNRETFCGKLFCRMKDLKPWPVFAISHDFAKGRGKLQ